MPWINVLIKLVTKPDQDPKRWDFWKIDENEEEDIVITNEKMDEMPHTVQPLIERENLNSN